ncbi:DNA-binding transcriptional regulator, AcrR family [Gillisia sp. Hel1_33_143]|uniref:TetR/AcrR family transcriptional regulator n=1 Tax=unclassified Gillisia TaxID=2615025 RepID=UPI00055884EF|nr:MULTISPECIES: TetR/AcrR family transcriptional regulator [unclassified Gillisia]SDS59313.1 DNA-binding transcriptional regulator, AcrR family [Gillisia sp. Hel1_33_143]
MSTVNKSQLKREALVKATINLVNNNGFHATPMSKIAKMANVSPATIYLYFENKQDLINKVYIQVKTAFTEYAFKDYAPTMDVEVGFKVIWNNIANFKLSDVDEAFFLSQCDNTPMVDEDSRQEGLKHLQPLLDLWQRGIDEKKIKPLSAYLLYAYTVYPVAFLMNMQQRDILKMDSKSLEDAYTAAWDSIKL